MSAAERVYTGTRTRKLGARPGMRAWLVDVDDRGFAQELQDDGVEIVSGPEGNPQLIFLEVRSPADLAGIATCRRHLPKDGALWLLRPKGKESAVPEREAMEAGLAAGLVDVKVVSFSPTHSALKYVYRLSDR